jgi:hypothetical protein
MVMPEVTVKVTAASNEDGTVVFQVNYIPAHHNSHAPGETKMKTGPMRSCTLYLSRNSQPEIETLIPVRGSRRSSIGASGTLIKMYMI